MFLTQGRGTSRNKTWGTKADGWCKGGAEVQLESEAGWGPDAANWAVVILFWGFLAKVLDQTMIG